MKSIAHIRPTRNVSDQSAEDQSYDPEAAFADPVRYLAGLGIESRLVGQTLQGSPEPAAVQEAA